MKVIGLFLAVLLFSTVSLAYAHPEPTFLKVVGPDGITLFENEVMAPKKPASESLEWFTKEWFDHNFIWILASTITITMTVAVLLTYREEIIPKIFKHNSV